MAGVVFVVPPGRPPSGGDLYNRFLFEALRAEGFHFETAPLEGPGLAAFEAFEEIWVDSLYIPKLTGALLGPTGRRPKVYLIVHYLPSEDPGIPPGLASTLRTAEDRLFGLISGCLATGPPTRDRLRARGYTAGPVLLVPPAPCVLPQGPCLTPAVFTALIVASLIRGKGVPDFLDALARQVRSGDEFQVRIAGRTDLEPETADACLRKVAAHPLLRGRVTHLSHLSLEELGREYERSSVLVSPSPREGYGMAFHEARVFGLPVLARRAEYSEPYIEARRTGFLYDSAAELTRGMLDLVRQPERTDRLGAAARERQEAAAYTWRDAARAFLRQREACGIVPSV